MDDPDMFGGNSVEMQITLPRARYNRLCHLADDLIKAHQLHIQITRPGSFATDRRVRISLTGPAADIQAAAAEMLEIDQRTPPRPGGFFQGLADKL